MKRKEKTNTQEGKKKIFDNATHQIEKQNID